MSFMISITSSWGISIWFAISSTVGLPPKLSVRYSMAAFRALTRAISSSSLDLRSASAFKAARTYIRISSTTVS